MFRHLALIAVAGLLVVHPSVAARAKKAAAEAAPAPTTSPEEQAMMEAWGKAKSPNEHHAALEPMVGTFDSTIKLWMGAGAPPSVSTGKTVNKWMLGGRYLQSTHRGEFEGEPFEGLGYTAHDNVQGKYVGTWMDNMGTGIMTSVGEMASPTEFTFIAKGWDAMSGQESTYRQKIVIKDRNSHVFEMWGADPDGVAFQMMEIVYTRR